MDAKVKSTFSFHVQVVKCYKTRSGEEGLFQWVQIVVKSFFFSNYTEFRTLLVILQNKIVHPVRKHTGSRIYLGHTWQEEEINVLKMAFLLRQP